MFKNVLILAGFAVAFATLFALANLPVKAPVASDRTVKPEAEVASETPAQKRTVVAFVGDSYTQGRGATDASARWSTLVANEMGWTEKNFGIGGTGYANSGSETANSDYSDRIQEIADASPQIVIVSGGRNDAMLPSNTVGQSVNSFYSGLRKALPDAQIIAVNPWWDATAPPLELSKISEQVKQAAASAEATFIDTDQPLAGSPDLMSADSVHPNNQGYRKLANSIISELE